MDQSNFNIGGAVVIAKSPEPAEFAILITQPRRPLSNETQHMNRANIHQLAKRHTPRKAGLICGIVKESNAQLLVAELWR